MEPLHYVVKSVIACAMRAAFRSICEWEDELAAALDYEAHCRREDGQCCPPQSLPRLVTESLGIACADITEAQVQLALALLPQLGNEATEAQEVRMTSVDRYGFEMSVKTERGSRPIRLAFEEEVENATEVRQALVALAKRARSE